MNGVCSAMEWRPMGRVSGRIVLHVQASKSIHIDL